MGIYFDEAKTLEDKKHIANEQVGKKIKKLRTAKKLTQAQFAKEYKIRGGNSEVSKIERAQRSLKAEMLPILAEDGNTTVEHFFREDVAVTRNIMHYCITKMDIGPNMIEPVMKYVDSVGKTALENIGPAKLFDLLFTVLRTAAKENSKGSMMDEINIIDLDEYTNNNSRYLNYLKEASYIYNKNE